MGIIYDSFDDVNGIREVMIIEDDHKHIFIDKSGVYENDNHVSFS